MILHHSAFKPVHLKASLKVGLLVSFCAHTAVAGAMMWFGSGDPTQSKQEEFEALEAKSVAVNALSADEVRALIAALENPDATTGDSTSPGTGGVSEAAPASAAPAPETIATLPSNRSSLGATNFSMLYLRNSLFVEIGF